MKERRQHLQQSRVKTQHFNLGSAFLALGVTSILGGSLSLYWRTGALLPDPHLFVGAGILWCWALAVSMVPLMQRGNDTARVAHITFNGIGLALFALQLPTGWRLVQMALQQTTWP